MSDSTSTSTSTSTGSALKGVWLALILLGAFVAAVLVGVGFALLGGTSPGALTAGGAVFIGLATLGMAARRFVAG